MAKYVTGIIYNSSSCLYRIPFFTFYFSKTILYCTRKNDIYQIKVHTKLLYKTVQIENMIKSKILERLHIIILNSQVSRIELIRIIAQAFQIYI